jgi:two-component system OmpR family response regulator
VRVLVAEDDPGLRSVLERGLRRSGYVVDAVPDGDRALRYLRGYDYEVAVLDWRMPGTSGLDVLRELRRRGSRVPVLMLTARDTTADRVEGLDAGADDYLVKPFEFAELLARMRALQRRPPVPVEPVVRVGDLTFDPAARQVRRRPPSPEAAGRGDGAGDGAVTADSAGKRDGAGDGAGEVLALTGRELAILELLMRRHPAVVERRTIALQVWDDEAEAVGSNTIDVHLARLRSKLVGSSVRIETVRGIGYRLAAG